MPTPAKLPIAPLCILQRALLRVSGKAARDVSVHHNGDNHEEQEVAQFDPAF